jgi:hypothetical protein
VNQRKALFLGSFLVAAGIVVLAGANATIESVIGEVLRLWPLAIIAIGVGLLLRRTRFALVGTLVAAIVPGLLLGGVVVAAPNITTICDQRDAGQTTTQDGAFVGRANIDLALACGDVTVTTVPGTSWSFGSVDIDGTPAQLVSTSDHLGVFSRDDDWRSGVGRDGDDWRLALPTGVPMDIYAEVSAGRGNFDLAGARIGDLAVVVNAGDLRLDLTTATVDRLDVKVNAGQGSVRLPIADVTGDLSAAAGSLELCVPADLGVRIHGAVVLGGATYNGLVRVGDAWETPGLSSMTNHADLSVTASAGSVVVNPEGDCK